MNASQHRRSMRGISLIEMLVAVVIGLVVVGAVLVSLLGSGQSGRFQAAYSQMNEDAQIALSILSRDLQVAGYAQPTSLVSNGAATPTLTLTSTALGANTFVFGCDTGFANPRATTLTCGTDTTPAFEVVYEADKSNTILTGGGIPSDCLGNGIGGVAPYVAKNRYFISSGASGRPELYCASNVALSAQPLVENIDTMKIWYGVSVAADPTQVVRYVTATDIAGLGAAAAAEWNRVISVRICLLVRSAEPVLSAEDTATYLDCDATSQNSADRYLRRAYFTTASLRNRMPI